MIILDRPYVSSVLADTVERLGVPVLDNPMSRELAKGRKVNVLSERDFIEMIRGQEYPSVYTNSEDSIGWIENNLGFTSLPGSITLCKDKIRFRELLADDHPELFFRGIDYGELDRFDTGSIKKPFIIKPAVGFFSLAVNKVVSDKHWPGILAGIKAAVEKVRGVYPLEVLDPGRFIIEENIEGDEYAIDLYYDRDGNPVILDVLKHVFASETDVSDRTYLTSKEIVEYGLEVFTPSLVRLGDLAGLRNAPMHVEYRVKEGNAVPIEANPMRFAAWCTTDIGWHAWGINTVEYFLNGIVPDWETVFRGREDKVYSLVVAFVPDGISVDKVKRIDFEAFEANFSKPLEFRRMDYRKYHVFEFVFSETDGSNRDEIDRMLRADLGRYVIS